MGPGQPADVLIAGAGPAGTAAAVTCAELGLRVTICERLSFPRHRPGEALHPGADALLAELGVLARVDQVTGHRYDGVVAAWGGPPRFEAFGSDADGPWLGRQVDRARFDDLLLQRALDLGVTVRQPCAVTSLVLAEGAVIGAETDAGPVGCGMLIDATGATRLASRKLGLPQTLASPPLAVRYGYARGAGARAWARPHLTADATGWTWIAQLAEDRAQWVRLDLSGRRTSEWRPEQLQDLRAEGAAHGADVAWRRTSPTAGPGWIIAGDAAVQLDPTSSHGVLKALAAGMMAGRTAAAVLSRAGDPRAAALAYDAWMGNGFDADAAALRGMYARLGAKFAAGGETREAGSAISA